MFGHTLNRDTWVPFAKSSYFSVGGTHRFLYSDLWVSMFIGHDNNFGSNICIPRYYLKHGQKATV
ncbi:MAG: hypothetical protein M2R45_03159 [Verrucomicrobia subdivision 3 bacterium]|nr:hypothetical protein [Limisphaerales bacterium]MCS1413226.1 hypothetical protein [Limisphaerales bacterium]